MTTSASTKLTYDDYAAFPEDGRRHEIIDGEHYVVPSPITKHQAISRRLEFALVKYLEQNRIGTVFDAPYDVVLSELDVVQPDILYIANEHSAIITEKNVQGAPDLVIEIISESTRHTDEITKRKLYERSGVSEYWVVDPVVDTVKIYRLIDRGYQRVAEVSNEAGGGLETPLLPDFVMDIGAVFRD
jgi:Uma2 family endonuclease